MSKSLRPAVVRSWANLLSSTALAELIALLSAILAERSERPEG